MLANNAAICCSGGGPQGARLTDKNLSVALTGQSTVRPKAGAGFLQKLEDALQAAVHSDGSGNYSSGANSGGGSLGGAQVIDFPMVDPYKPLRRAGRPKIAGYNAFPAPVVNVQPYLSRPGMLADVSRPGGVRRSAFNARGDDKSASLPPGSESLGFVDNSSDLFHTSEGIRLPTYSAGPTKLQSIIGGIAATLPATVAAFRASPQNLNLQQYQPYQAGVYQGGAGGAGADIGAQTGAAVGNVGDTISNIVAQHPYLVLAGGAALVLLFMSPPRRR